MKPRDAVGRRLMISRAQQSRHLKIVLLQLAALLAGEGAAFLHREGHPRHAAHALRENATGQVMAASTEQKPNCFSTPDSASALNSHLLRALVPGPKKEARPGCRYVNQANYDHRSCRSLPSLSLQAPESCSLQEFDAQSFLDLLGARTLWILGDSVQRQLYAVLVHCMLATHIRQPSIRPYAPPGGGAPTGRRRLLKRSSKPKSHSSRPSKPTKQSYEQRMTKHAAQVAHTVGSVKVFGARMPETRPLNEVPEDAQCNHMCTEFVTGAVICYVGSPVMLVCKVTAGCWKRMSPRDIVVANLGVWFNGPKGANELRSSMRQFTEFVRANERANVTLPTIIWRDTHPQHFSCGGNYCADDSRNNKCMAIKLEVLSKHEFRNKVALPFVADLGIPVLNVWSLSAAHHELHPAQIVRDTIADCTHLCNHPGGVIEEGWVPLLQNLIGSVLRRAADVPNN